MTISQLITIILGRWKFILITIAVCLGLAAGITAIMPTKYKATATVVLDFKGQDPVLGMLMQNSGASVNTQTDIIKSKRTAIEVIRILKLADSPALRQQFIEANNGLGDIEDWFADILLKNLEARPGRDTSVVDITFEGGEPRFAAQIANAFADAYQRINLDLRVDPARQSAAWFDERVQALRANVEKAQANLSAYQREKGFSAVDERADVETSRLTELSGQLTAAQANAADALSRQRQLQEFLKRGASVESIPDILANGLIQNLKSQLATSESRLEQLSNQFGANHPEVTRLQADIAKQKERLKSEVVTVSESVSNALRIAQRREAELRSAVSEQRTKLLKFNQGRDEMAGLIKDAESAQHAYEQASQRFTQTNLESQATQTTIMVLNRALPPVTPSAPRPFVNMIVGFVAGVVLAFGLAIGLELLDRRIRSEEDILLALDAPLLGVLDSRKARVKVAKKRRFRLPWRARPTLPAPA